jgi:uroporphyrinogen decarboxylase
VINDKEQSFQLNINSLKKEGNKKPIPVLSFPCVSLLGITVRELISDSELQAKGMKLVADRTDAGASVSFMDLSVEAECFGATVAVSDDEVPTVKGRIINNMDEAEALKVPAIGSGRTQIYIDAIEKACKEITDRPVLNVTVPNFYVQSKKALRFIAVKIFTTTDIIIIPHTIPADIEHVLLKAFAKFVKSCSNKYLML